MDSIKLSTSYNMQSEDFNDHPEMRDSGLVSQKKRKRDYPSNDPFWKIDEALFRLSSFFLRK